MPNQQTIALILTLLEHEALSPRDLLNGLRDQGVSQAEAKENLSFLVNDERVQLTQESTLRRTASHVGV